MPSPPPAPKLYFPPMLSMPATDAIIFTLYAVATVTTVVRLYTRGVVLRAFGLDDLLMVIATLLGAVTSATHHLKLAPLRGIYMMMIHNNSTKLTPPMLTLLGRSIRAVFGGGFAYIFELMYALPPSSSRRWSIELTEIRFIKLSILAFYRRVAVSRKHHLLLWITAACIIGYCFANNIATMFTTNPVNAAWDIRVKAKSHGFRTEDLQNSNSIFQSIIDVVILLLPIPILVKLQTNRRTKLGLAFVFSLGIFSLVTTIIRLRTSIRFSRLKTLVEGIAMEPELSYWSDVELNTAIICANCPAISALFRGFSKSRSTRASGSGGKRSNDYEKRKYPSSPSTVGSQTGFAGRGFVSHHASTASSGGGDGKTFLHDPSVVHGGGGGGGDVVGFDAPLPELPYAASMPAPAPVAMAHVSSFPAPARGGITRTQEFRMDIERGERAEKGEKAERY
ncbi:MAG: hypothetical protein M1826_006149 [Phylliscum demangeonii]|nr:MAG: hypothetical protein M1826_006149 [Phylliscum demangeonii]